MIMNIPKTNSSTKSFSDRILLYWAINAVVAIIFILIDRYAGTPEIITGYVIEKHLEAEITPTMGRKSQSAKDIKKDDDYVLIIFSNGHSTAVACEPEYFYSASLGQEVKYLSNKGCITGLDWNKTIIQ